MNLVLIYKLIKFDRKQRRLLSKKQVNGLIKRVKIDDDFIFCDIEGDHNIESEYDDLDGNVIFNSSIPFDTISVNSISSTTTNCSHLFDSSRLDRFGLGQVRGTPFLTPLHPIQEKSPQYFIKENEDSIQNYNNFYEEID